MPKFQPYYKNKNGELVQIELPYQEELESGVNIKTVNGESILGNGNIFIENSSSKWVKDNGGKLYSTKKYYVKIPGGLESLSYEEGYLIATTNYNNFSIYLLKNTTNDIHVLLTDPSDISISSTFSTLSQTQGEQDIYEFTTLELFNDSTYISSDNAIAYLVKIDNISRVLDLTNYSSGETLDDETYKTIKENPSSVFLQLEDPTYGPYVLANHYYTDEDGNITYSYFWKEPDTYVILSGYIFIDTDKIISFETYEEELVTQDQIDRLNCIEIIDLTESGDVYEPGEQYQHPDQGLFDRALTLGKYGVVYFNDSIHANTRQAFYRFNSDTNVCYEYIYADEDNPKILYQGYITIEQGPNIIMSEIDTINGSGGSSKWIKLTGVQTADSTKPLYIKIDTMPNNEEYIQISEGGLSIYLYNNNGTILLCTDGDYTNRFDDINSDNLVEGETNVYTFNTIGVMNGVTFTPITTNSAYLVYDIIGAINELASKVVNLENSLENSSTILASLVEV